jgi:hypothetical protein
VQRVAQWLKRHPQADKLMQAMRNDFAAFIRTAEADAREANSAAPQSAEIILQVNREVKADNIILAMAGFGAMLIEQQRRFVDQDGVRHQACSVPSINRPPWLSVSRAPGYSAIALSSAARATTMFDDRGDHAVKRTVRLQRFRPHDLTIRGP